MTKQSRESPLAFFADNRMHADCVDHVMSERLYCVYILTNSRHTALYTGVTGDLKKRVWEHREKLVEGFTRSYDVTELVYYETCAHVLGAIAREKQIKAGSRAKKVALVNGMNPEWRDLYDDL